MEIKAITANTVKTLTEIGQHTTGVAKRAGRFFNGVAGTANDTYIVNKLKENNVSKETFIGAGILAAGVILAVKCVKGVNKAIQNIRNDAN